MLYSPPNLHIPDGFLSILISIFFWAVTILIVGLAIKRIKDVDDSQIPLMGVMAAFIFAAQMINFPVAGGTSGHLLGGTLAAIMLGPWAGILVMTSVVSLQGLLFQDGGLLVMGANIFNMGIITSLIGFGFYRSVLNHSKKFRLGIAGIAAWLGVIAAALMTAIQLWLSGTSPARIVFPAMIGIHSVIGIGEALITVAALAFVLKVRPGLLSKEKLEKQGSTRLAIPGILIAIFVVFLSPFASSNPDGLERVAENLGFIDLGQASIFEIFPDYILPALGDSQFSGIIAGLIGIGAVAAVAILVGKLIKKRKTA